MNKRSIYLVFSRTGTWLSRSIGFVTQTEYPHVSLSLDLSFNKMYSFGRIEPDNPFSGGLTIENIHSGVFQKSPKTRCLIYRLDITEEQFNTLQREINIFYNSNINYRYNFIGLFGVLVDKPIHRNNHYFCSQFITTLLKRSNIWNSPKIPELTSPTDLMKIPNKTKIFEGFIKELDFNVDSQIALIV